MYCCERERATVAATDAVDKDINGAQMNFADREALFTDAIASLELVRAEKIAGDNSSEMRSAYRGG